MSSKIEIKPSDKRYTTTKIGDIRLNTYCPENAREFIDKLEKLINRCENKAKVNFYVVEEYGGESYFIEVLDSRMETTKEARARMEKEQERNKELQKYQLDSLAKSLGYKIVKE